MTQSANTPQNLFGLDREQLRACFAEMGEKPFRADQIMQWIYRRTADDFDLMTNISKDLRTKMKERFVIKHPELVAEQVSQDGTRKWVLRLDGGNAIETVFIPEDDRGTLCISSQVGCAMDCSFCSTAQQGLNRNMTTAEIVAQVWFAAKTLGGDFQNERVISNVVFMGMGEPLANTAAVLPAIHIMLDDFGFGLSKRRVTVSTSGLVPYIDRLRADCDTALAVSLHAPNDELRDKLVPINKKYPIAELMDACRRYLEGKDRKTHIVFEYVMLDGVNDHPEHARQLAKLLAGMAAKVNLIPFNPFPEAGYKRSKPEAIKRFSDILREKKIVTTTRKTRGDDIDAACGQLVGKVQSRQKNRLSGIPVVTQ
ncbi:23S rRNA (adenine(2503)-C(2))-methyltransferase RlmN [Stenotrophobium rhamnosiphilum]|uniref:Dual-specificity RNA methyltransferase RlmN n=1 Tax=Stenotrophobium rhamnosiphilum TaxID=2029166 RepID=A0A2T5MIC9_9GAMM|nr:23S rRNA (adenine(2503)-C(2))-methyltransferase RlmN [Stenotrophobium rhamnosiphilum]PTU32346.1 23S rRNA (adenine(2503)-C(2))-methyltransferase RlmN [Stenotrophobium rhamnosiphilum]